MKLITEQCDQVKYITEDNKDGGRDHFITGVFLQGGVKNRNGRYYPESVLDEAVGRYMSELVNDRRAWGELGDPAGPQINLERVSHRILELHKEGNDYTGKAILTNTPYGNIAKGLLESGGKFGVSSRGSWITEGR